MFPHIFYGLLLKGCDMSKEPENFKLPENLYNEILNFFRKTSLPRIQRQREREKAKNTKDAPFEKIK
jgi:hypothetical protein